MLLSGNAGNVILSGHGGNGNANLGSGRENSGPVSGIQNINPDGYAVSPSMNTLDLRNQNSNRASTINRSPSARALGL